MTLINELISVEDFVKAKFSGSATFKQTAPKQPEADTFVIAFLSDRRESETAAHYRIDREYQVIYYGVDVPDVLAKMDVLSQALYQARVIPIVDSLRYIRISSFSVSRPFKTDNEIYAAIGVLSTEVRQARDQASYQKMQHINATINEAP